MSNVVSRTHARLRQQLLHVVHHLSVTQNWVLWIVALCVPCSDCMLRYLGQGYWLEGGKFYPSDKSRCWLPFMLCVWLIESMCPRRSFRVTRLPTTIVLQSLMEKIFRLSSSDARSSLLSHGHRCQDCYHQHPCRRGQRVPKGFQSFLDTGLVGAIVLTIIGSFAWCSIASSFPLAFMSNPAISLVVEGTGICSAARLLALIHESIVNYQPDDVYLGWEDEEV